MKEEELTVGGIRQLAGYLSIKNIPLSEQQLDAARQLIKQIEDAKQ